MNKLVFFMKYSLGYIVTAMQNGPEQTAASERASEGVRVLTEHCSPESTLHLCQHWE